MKMLLLYKFFSKKNFVQCCVRKSAGTKKISNVTKIGPFKDTLQNLAPVQHRTNKELTQFYFHLAYGKSDKFYLGENYLRYSSL